MRNFLGYSLAALLTASVALPAFAQTGSAPGGTPAMTRPATEAPKAAAVAPKAVPAKPVAAAPAQGGIAGQKPAVAPTSTVAPAPTAPVTKSN